MVLNANTQKRLQRHKAISHVIQFHFELIAKIQPTLKPRHEKNDNAQNRFSNTRRKKNDKKSRMKATITNFHPFGNNTISFVQN